MARPEGVRVKHRVNGNAVKMYNKQGSVLRVETVINQARDLTRVSAQRGGPGRARSSWRYLRKGVADAWRRAELSQQANERYLEALAAATEPTPLGTLSQPLCRRVRYHGHSVRALNPLAADDAALLAIDRTAGSSCITGLRNRDLRRLLYPAASDAADATAGARGRSRVSCGCCGRTGSCAKCRTRHRYFLTPKGRVVVAALLAAHQADMATLAAAA